MRQGHPGHSGWLHLCGEFIDSTDDFDGLSLDTTIDSMGRFIILFSYFATCKMTCLMTVMTISNI